MGEEDSPPADHVSVTSDVELRMISKADSYRVSGINSAKEKLNRFHGCLMRGPFFKDQASYLF